MMMMTMMTMMVAMAMAMTMATMMAVVAVMVTMMIAWPLPSRQDTASATSAMASTAATMALRIEGHLAKIEGKVESRAAVTTTKQTHPGEDPEDSEIAARAVRPLQAFSIRHCCAGYSWQISMILMDLGEGLVLEHLDDKQRLRW